jgi:hypothetical protein
MPRTDSALWPTWTSYYTLLSPGMLSHRVERHFRLRNNQVYWSARRGWGVVNLVFADNHFRRMVVGPLDWFAQAEGNPPFVVKSVRTGIRNATVGLWGKRQSADWSVAGALTPCRPARMQIVLELLEVRCDRHAQLNWISLGAGRASRSKPSSRSEMSYKHDIFISYRRNPETLAWIKDHFEPLLSLRVEFELQRRPTIYIDEQVESGTSWPPAIPRRSANPVC